MISPIDKIQEIIGSKGKTESVETLVGHFCGEVCNNDQVLKDLTARKILS